MLNLAYLSLGSNIEPETNLLKAVERLAAATRLQAVSSVWETKPVGLADQPNFLNAAALVATPLPAALLKSNVLATIERDLGRVRQANKNAPRQIDLDIMLFNQDILEVGRRRIPDPEVLERAFVAVPLAEIAPAYVHPETGQRLQEIAGQFSNVAADMYLRPDISKQLVQLCVKL